MSATAIVAAAVIGAGSTMYASDEQSRIAREQQDKLDAAEKARILEAERIARETRPDAETLSSAKFGVDSGTVGSTKDFAIQKTTSTALGTSTSTSGLGFNV